ncbi:cobalamin biosynthesis protein CbiE [Bacillus sp. MUM 116]|uniref:bifunctional cobalt-precorrin-7 (C(5))-methyltransferase/cobalt-precorrin-6B (C(15))-methyltransferase n=1 Tax=Bacillus sp. MUM 116 TaxID=1678002 RepID=UPI0008F5EAE1|nr:bifunctional cobalt-precorrin-7 (C(5))-methyltransferase/cobalt-precorrin-6B (C(15))-methyltransferase [Bacillus sp. MUM 116]OIK09221.1 cobalamin biosynthesis protein CbiE [Bacillus sp. MUM 116]
MIASIKMIGIGDEGKLTLLPMYEKWIEESDILIGGKRQLSFFPEYEGEKIVIEGGLSSLVDRLKTESKKVVILASGDPLFYGIGGYLSSKIDLEIYPHLSSVQLAFAKMGERWQDAYFTSVHGRSMKGLAQRIDGKEKVAILTDVENSPNKIAEYMLSFGMTEYQVFVGENLGGENERCRWFILEEMKDAEFSPLNVVVLRKTDNTTRWSIGINDEEFFQRKPDKGLITKKEIRTLSISSLRLKEDSIVWDIGTCTGSVAIEAAKIAREGQIFAIEKNEGDLENCKQNLVKFRVDATLIHGKAPEGLDAFPDPDAVFIGGTAGGMGEILDICCGRLREGGRIVLNAVTIENLSEAMTAFKERGFDTSITLAQISRSKPILNLTRFDALNPIYIIEAWRQEGE